MPEFDLAAVTLEVIDATLSGEAVGPEHAELAELALILADERPTPGLEFTQALDARVECRFAPAPHGRAPKRRRRRWLFAPGAAVGLAAVAALLVVALNNGRSVPARRTTTAVLQQDSAGAARHPSSAFGGTPSRGSAASAAGASPTRSAGATNLSAASLPAQLSSGAPGAQRSVIRGAQLSLAARQGQVESVAQQVFTVVAAQGGFVQNSNVSAGRPTGYAQFAISVPSARLAQTLGQLSTLHGARVVSRSDTTQDVTAQLGSDGRRLAEARALRTALLRRLAAATTPQAISSLKAQIHDADASIARDLTILRSLHHQVNESQIYLTINGGGVAPGPVDSSPPSSGGSFTLGQALHDAGRVLVVAAGVALIALAALVPLGLLVALAVWMAALVRRRRREQALDLL